MKESGFATSDFWLHLAAMFSCSIAFWMLVSYFRSMQPLITPGTPVLTLLICLAVAFALYAVALVSLVHSHRDTRVRQAILESQETVTNGDYLSPPRTHL